MTSDTVSGLLGRVEEADGPDRELDFWLTVRLWDPGPETDAELLADIALVGIEGMYVEAPYTTSLDAALALVERVFPGAWYLLGKGQLRATEPLYGAQIMFGSAVVLGAGEHNASQALALLAALLRALSASTVGE